MSAKIKIRGAREHNLKNIDLDIPKDKLVVLTGVSGSGKSSLAFDTIYAEGQRRYVESLSSYARQFLGVMGKPDVDLIEGLSPAISIDQKTTSHNPRSTVGTVTEVYDYLRLLYSRVGHPHCPECGDEISSQSLDEIVGGVMELIKAEAKTHKKARCLVLSPVVSNRKGEFSSLLDNLRAKGFRQIRIDGHVKDLEEDFLIIKTNKHNIDVVVDRVSMVESDLKQEVLEANLKSRLTESVETALGLSDGMVVVGLVRDNGLEMPGYPKDIEDHLFSERFACAKDNISLPEIEPRSFSFNSPQGACAKCNGIGRILKVDPELLLSGELSIKEGGILPFSNMFEHDTWYSRLILQMCKGEGIDVRKPIKKLTKAEIETLLNGTGAKMYRVLGTNRSGRMTSIRETYSGIVAELTRRHRNTESDYVRGSIEKFMREVVCDSCNGTRLKKEALGVTIDGKNIDDVVNMSINEGLVWFKSLEKGALNQREREIAKLVLKEIVVRVGFLESVGLGYLSLGRRAGTLAGGEAQRIRLASQIGSGLTGVLYVLDEPTIGLHARDNERLITTLKRLRDLGNTVVVVEHDKEMMCEANYIVDFGPGAGKSGGEVVAKGTLAEIKKESRSLTGKYLSGKKKIAMKSDERYVNGKEGKSLEITGCSQFNLKNVDLKVPLGKLVVVTGVSGSGKSTLVVETLFHGLARELNPYHRQNPGEYSEIKGVDEIGNVSLIDQSPIGRTPRSNPATYTKVFNSIREVFSETRDAKTAGYKPGRFSFNVKGGRCEACEGQGQNKIEMQFMADIWVECELCKGKRYNSSTLEVTYRGKNISEVLDMTVGEAREFFHAHPNIVRKLETLGEVGLDYMELGQSAPTLSGGEAQRVKLASELTKKHSGHTLYILDEPTTGLHFADLERLLSVLRMLVEKGNTVVVIEHNMDVIKKADWIVDLGPEGGDGGGRIVTTGTAEKIMKTKGSHTGEFLSRAS